ncbi:MAG: hypothetical protein RL142_696 [Actinomycetota bacterium]|jgi:MFS family permease
MTKPKALAPFRHRNFRLLYPATALSNIGTWAQRIAQDWLVLELTGSAAALGIVTALQFGPTLILSTVGGILADRFDKRKLLFLSNAGSSLVAMVLGITVVTGSANIWFVYLMAFLLGSFNAIDAPIRQTFTSELVPTDDVPGAISLNSINFNVGRLVGPGLSGLMIAAFGTGPSFLLNSLSYIVMLVALLYVHKEELNLIEKPKEKAKLKEAFHYFKDRVDLQIVLYIAFIAATFGMNHQIFNALMATDEFKQGPAEFGALGTFLAFGSLAGAFLTARNQRFKNPKGIAIGSVLFGLSIVIMAFSPTYLVYSLLLPFDGLIAILTLVSANTYIQTTTDAHIRGRVIGIYMMVLMGGTPVGSPFLGWLAETFGIRTGMIVFGLITAVGSAIFYLMLRSRISTTSK